LQSVFVSVDGNRNLVAKKKNRLSQINLVDLYRSARERCCDGNQFIVSLLNPFMYPLQRARLMMMMMMGRE
jgi:hypothetical protein